MCIIYRWIISYSVLEHAVAFNLKIKISPYFILQVTGTNKCIFYPWLG